jgi:hypothetical protein
VVHEIPQQGFMVARPSEMCLRIAAEAFSKPA